MEPENQNLIGSAETIDQIITWIRRAGQIARQHFDHITPQLKPDQTFVTRADLEIERFLSGQIKATFPTHLVIGEEQAKDRRVESAPYVWAIDPIDGTTAFVQGLPGWGISLGLLHRGQPRLGFFYMPLLDDLTYTNHQGEVYCNARHLRQTIKRHIGIKDFLAVNASAHSEFKIDFPRTRALGSIGANLVYTARGTSAGAFIPKAHLWDLVAGAAILIGVGGELRYIDGRPADFLELLDGRLTPEPVIAGHPDLQAELRQMIKPYS